MESTPQSRVKICCVGSVEEGRLAIRYGAAAPDVLKARNPCKRSAAGCVAGAGHPCHG